MKARQRSREASAGDDMLDTDHHGAFRAQHRFTQPLVSVVKLRQCRTTRVQIPGPFRSQCQTPRAAVAQFGTQILLEPVDQLGDGGGADPEPAGRP